MNKIRPKKSRGFTLVEVAVVLFFMGIFVSFAASMMKNIALSTKLRDARDKLTTVSDSAQSWANKNRRLPTNATFENFTGVLVHPRDYWSQKYRYYPYTPVSGSMDDICKISTTNLSICPGGSCISTNLVADIAYVIVSNGDNLAVNTSLVTTLPPCTVPKPCVPINDLSTTNDDLFKYVTLAELKKTAGCIEADSRLRIINGEQLTWAHENVPYTPVVIQADGGLLFSGVNKYKWCIASGSLPAGMQFVPVIAPCSDPTPTQVTSFSISGTPVTGISVGTSSTSTISITLKDANNTTISKPFFLNVANP